ncbi:MAG: hypothetical protein K6A67_05050 [Bacteroidales bacterium]|nr:hypothetical protein [Bacteroidales bacterium]
MKTKEQIIDIISKADMKLSYVETTASRTGYPENCSFAITGFEDYEQAEKFAKENGLQLIWLKKRDGQQLWTREGDYRGDPITVCSERFGDNAEVFDSVEELDDDRRETLKAFIDDEVPVETISKFVATWKEAHDELEGAGDGSVAVLIDGQLEGIYPKHPTEFSWDSKTEVLAAVLK